MSGELRERLSRLDPMHSGVPTESTTTESSQELLETIMNTDIKETPEKPAGSSRRLATVAVAAVAALVLAVAGGIAIYGNEDAPPTASETPLELSTGEDNALGSCIMFSPGELDRVAEIAFEGTVTEVDGDTVTLTVDRWFRGGDDVSQVVLRAPQGLQALIDGIAFEVGEQYLISAQGGTVNYCGFSGLSTEQLRSGFEAAFAQG